MTRCYYPVYENADPNEFAVGRHKWGKDGYCIICGEKRKKGNCCNHEDCHIYCGVCITKGCYYDKKI